MDSFPQGYKIWIGDLPRDTTKEETKQRVWDTLDAKKITPLWADILSIVLKEARAGSGSSYCVLTIGDIKNALATQLIFNFNLQLHIVFGVQNVPTVVQLWVNSGSMVGQHLNLKFQDLLNKGVAMMVKCVSSMGQNRSSGRPSIPPGRTGSTWTQSGS